MSLSNMDDLMDVAINQLSFSGVDSSVRAVKKDFYKQLTAFQNVTSFSMQSVFHECPRKFALKKLRASLDVDSGMDDERNDNITFAFGHAVGAGVAELDKTGDIDSAIWAAFLAWDVDLLAEEMKGTRKTNKSIFEAVWSLFVWKEFRQTQTDLDDYEVIQTEATMVVDMQTGDAESGKPTQFYVGHLDELLQNKHTGTYRVKENKTTRAVNVDAAAYSNSDQGLSYAVLADMLGAQDYEVMYTVYSTADREWLQFSFVKDAKKKAEWLQDQLLQIAQREQYAELKFFPKRGNSCNNFGRRCSEYELCDMNVRGRFGKEFTELPVAHSVEDIKALEPVHYFTTMSEIVARQKEKLGLSV